MPKFGRMPSSKNTLRPTPITMGSCRAEHKAFIEVMRKKNPQGKLIWASTSPISLRDKPAELDLQSNPISIEHNRMGGWVMTIKSHCAKPSGSSSLMVFTPPKRANDPKTTRAGVAHQGTPCRPWPVQKAGQNHHLWLLNFEPVELRRR